MKNIQIVTSRKLVKGVFFAQLEKIAREQPLRIILREHDMPKAEYLKFAEKCNHICQTYDVPLFPNSVLGTGLPDLHVKMDMLIKNPNLKKESRVLGVSIHSSEEGIKAQELGADYLIAGHIFETESKSGSPGKGLAFLKEICDSVSIPVYGIGGINPVNASSVLAAGAAGITLMSSVMKAENVHKFFLDFIQRDKI